MVGSQEFPDSREISGRFSSTDSLPPVSVSRAEPKTSSQENLRAPESTLACLPPSASGPFSLPAKTHAVAHAVASWESFLELFPRHARVDLLRKQPKSTAPLRRLTRLLHSLPVHTHQALWLSVVRLAKTITKSNASPGALGVSGDQPSPKAVSLESETETSSKHARADDFNSEKGGQPQRPASGSSCEKADASPEAVLLNRFAALTLFLGAFLDHRVAVGQQRRRRLHAAEQKAAALQKSQGNDDICGRVSSFQEQEDTDGKDAPAAVSEDSLPFRPSVQSQPQADRLSEHTAAGCTYAPPVGVYLVASFLKSNCFRLRLPGKKPLRERAAVETESATDGEETTCASTASPRRTCVDCDCPEEGTSRRSAEGENADDKEKAENPSVQTPAGTERSCSGVSGDSCEVDFAEELRLIQERIGDIVVKLADLGLFVSLPAASRLQSRSGKAFALGRNFQEMPPEGGAGEEFEMEKNSEEADPDAGEIKQLPMLGRQSFVLSALLHHLQQVAAATSDPPELSQRLRGLARFARRPHVAAPLDRALAGADRVCSRPSRFASCSSSSSSSSPSSSASSSSSSASFSSDGGSFQQASLFEVAAPGERGRRERDVVVEKVLVLVLLLLQPPAFPLLRDEGTQRLVASWWGRHTSLRELFFNNLLGVLEDEDVPLWQLEALGKFFFLAVKLSLSSPAPLTLELQQVLRACVASPLSLAHRCRVFLTPFFRQPEFSLSSQEAPDCRLPTNVVGLADAFLWRSLKSPNWQVRFNAVCLWQLLSSSHLSLQQQHCQFFLATLKQTLEDPSPSVRLATAAFVSSLLRRCCTSAALPPSSQMRAQILSSPQLPRKAETQSRVWLLSPEIFSSLLDLLLSAAADKSAPLVRAQALLAIQGVAQPVCSTEGDTGALHLLEDGERSVDLRSPEGSEGAQVSSGASSRRAQLARDAAHAAARKAILDLAPRLWSMLHDASPCVRLAAAMLIQGNGGVCRGGTEKRSLSGDATRDGVAQKKPRGAAGMCGDAETAAGRTDGEVKDAREEVSFGQDLWETEGRERNPREDGESRVKEYVWSRCTRDFLIGLLSGQHTERVTGVAFLKRRQIEDKRNEQSKGRCGAERPSKKSYQRGESERTENSKNRLGALWGPGAEEASGGADGGAQGDRPEARRSRKRKTAAAFASAFASTVLAAGEAGESPFGVAALWRGDKERTHVDSTANAAELHTAGPMEVSRHLARQLLFQLFKMPLQEQAFQVKGLCRTHVPLVYALAAHVGACACLSEPFDSRVFSGSSPSASEEERRCSGQSCWPGVSYVDRCKLGVALFSQVRAEIVAYEKAKRRVGHREAPPSSEPRDARKVREKKSRFPRPFPAYRGSLVVEWQAQLAMSAQLLRPHCLERDEKLLEEQPLLRRFIVNSIPEEDLLASLQHTAGGAVLQYSYWSVFASLPSCVTCPSPSPLNTASSQQPSTSRHSGQRHLFPSSLLPACDTEAALWPVVPNSPNSDFSGAQSSVAAAPAAAAPVSPYARVLELFIREVSRFLDGRRCAAVHALPAYSAAHTCHVVLAAPSAENRPEGACGVHTPQGAGEKRVAAGPPERVSGGESASEWTCGRSESSERRGHLSAAGEGGVGVRSCTRQGCRDVSEENGARARRGGAVRHSTHAHRQPPKTPADGESQLRRTKEPEDICEKRKRRCLRLEREGGEGKKSWSRKGPQAEIGSEKDGRGVEGSCGERRRGERGNDESSCQRDEADGVVTLTCPSSPMEEDARDGQRTSPAESESGSVSVRLLASHLHEDHEKGEAVPEGWPLPSWLQRRSEAEVDSALFLDVLLPFLLRDARLRRWLSLQLARILLPLVATLEQQKQLLAGEVSPHEPSEASCAGARRESFVCGSASGLTASADEERRENPLFAAVERPSESAVREAGSPDEAQRRSRESNARRVSLEPGESRDHVPYLTENSRPSSPRGATLRSTGAARTDKNDGRKKTLTRRQKALLEQKAARESGGESGAEREESACTDSQESGGRNADDSREKQRGDAEESEAASEVSEDETSEEDDLKDEDFQLGGTRATKRRKPGAHSRGSTKKRRGDAPSPEKQQPNSTGDSAFELQQGLLCKSLRQTPVPQCFALSYRGSAPVSVSVGSSLVTCSSARAPSSPLTPSFLSLPAFVAALEIVALLRHLPLGREILVGLEGPLHTSGDNSEADRSVSADSREDRKPLDLLAPLPLHGLLMHAGVAFLRALGELLRRRAFQVPDSAAVSSLPEFGADDAVESAKNPPLPLEIFSVGANARSAASRHRAQAPLQAVLRQFPRERLTLQRFLFKRALDVFCSLGQLAAVYPRQISETAVLNPTLVEFSRLLEPLSTVARCVWREAELVPRTVSLLSSGGSGEERMQWLAAAREEQGGEDSPAVQAPPRGHQRRLRSRGISCEVDGTGDRGEVTAGQQSMRGPSSEKCADSTHPQSVIAGDKAAPLKRWRRNIHLILEIYGVVCEHLAFFFSVPISWERHRACKSSAGKELFARTLARLPAFLEAMFTWVDFFKATSDRLAAFEQHSEGLQSAKDALGENRAARTQEKQDGRQIDHGNLSAKDEVAGLARLSWNSGACVGHAVCDFWQDAVLQGELHSEDKTRRGKTGDEQRDQPEECSPEPNVEPGESRQPVDKENASFHTTQEVQSQKQRPLWTLNRREQTQEPRTCGGKAAAVLVSPAMRNERQRARDEESETDAVSMEENAVQVLRVLLARGASGKIQAAKLTSLLGRFLRTFPNNDTVRSLLREADHE